ncbi:RING finger membrane protein [Pseudozyma hubeiensis SY62]|uniref:RING finger membrane protein n=1 Tax=Pseudozyma hubeiensis (strain SY62) TaxID=1305764 RepID=R9PAJ0_PSEHS|nr:RING finger membrane protein [Pseudozyma hubeiensis SY62]GAC98376.1 RING finger membrane protein [Pseudozyma hubeiensis SY62]
MADRLHPPYHNTPSQIRSTSANLNVLLACALLLLLRDPPNAFGSPSHPFEFRTIRVPHNSSSPPTVPSYHLEATTFCLPWKIEGAASNHIPGPPFVSRFRKISPPQTGPHILRSVVCTYSILPEASRPRQAGLFIASLSASVFAAFPKASSTDQNLSGIILRISDRHCFRADFGRTAHSSSTPIISLDRVCRLSSVSTNNRLCFRSQLVPATSKITAALVIPFDKVGIALVTFPIESTCGSPLLQGAMEDASSLSSQLP